MLITPTQKTLYATTASRATALYAWCQQHPEHLADMPPFWQQWQATDRGSLTMPSALRAATDALDTAESAAVGFGYMPPTMPVMAAMNAYGSSHAAGGILDDIVDAATHATESAASLLPDSANPFAPSDAVQASVAATAAAWAKLETQMAADPKLATVLKPQHDAWHTFYANWQSGTRNLTDVNAQVAAVNVARRTAGGFDQSTDPGAVTGVDIAQESLALQGAASIEDYCVAHPHDHLCAATAPQDRSLCQRLDIMPDFVCEHFGWYLGGAVALFLGGLGFVAYKGAKAVAPYAIAHYAPSMLPAYQAQRAGNSEAAQDHILQTIAAQSAKRNAT
jgi:hypothetical protein